MQYMNTVAFGRVPYSNLLVIGRAPVLTSGALQSAHSRPIEFAVQLSTPLRGDSRSADHSG